MRIVYLLSHSIGPKCVHHAIIYMQSTSLSSPLPHPTHRLEQVQEFLVALRCTLPAHLLLRWRRLAISR